MYKKVLLPISLDHPESWKKALPEASALVRASEGELHIMTVVPDFGMASLQDFFPDDFEAKALSKAKADIDALASTEVEEGVKFETHLGHGSVVEHVLDMAAQLEVDLIVLASHQPDRMREFLVGSNADKIVHRSPVSVLVTRG